MVAISEKTGFPSKIALSYSDCNNSWVVHLTPLRLKKRLVLPELFHALNEAKNLKRSDIQEKRSLFLLGKKKKNN